MPGIDFEIAIDFVVDAFITVLQSSPTLSVKYVVAWITVILSSLSLIATVLGLSAKAIKVGREDIVPYFYNVEKKKRRTQRQRFAEHIEYGIRRLNSLETWSDYRFTELEAEVEAEGSRRIWLPFFTRYDQLRRESSLSKAIQRSTERLILLEGEPGSGKSVALRHVTLKMAQKAVKARNLQFVIPLYINLKSLERGDNEPIDQNLIYQFVLRTLNRANDRDIEAFLEVEFDRGLQDGTWLFLFDSFDEIPEILSSTEANELIVSYAEAIYDFLHGMNKCRGIIASREYRGPRYLGWPRFRVLPLSEKRQTELIRRSNPKNAYESMIIGGLGAAVLGMRSMASNPMYLGLLCEYVQKKEQFPQNPYEVFDVYIQYRLDHDADRLQNRFGFNSTMLREAAEKIAFCMTSNSELSLNPNRDELEAKMQQQGLGLGDQFHSLLDALQFLKLARTETEISSGEAQSFTFAHRRFQEYFATSIILREPERVSPEQLLIDGQWRETVVVLLQTQPEEKLDSILTKANDLLAKIWADVSDYIDQIKLPEDSDQKAGFEISFFDPQEKATHSIKLPRIVQPFNWPDSSHHLMSVIQDGLIDRRDIIPQVIRNDVTLVVLAVWGTGTWLDNKWVLEVSGIANQQTLTNFIKGSLYHPSEGVRDNAYKQIANLQEIPPEIVTAILANLCNMWETGRMRREKYVTQEYLRRLDKSEYFLQNLWYLRYLKLTDTIVNIIAIAVVWWAPSVLVPKIINPEEMELVQDIQMSFTIIITVTVILAWHNWTLPYSLKLRNFYLGIVIFFIAMFIVAENWGNQFSAVLKFIGQTFRSIITPAGIFGVVLPIFIPLFFLTWMPFVLKSIQAGRLRSRLVWGVSLILHPLFSSSWALYDGFIKDYFDGISNDFFNYKEIEGNFKRILAWMASLILMILFCGVSIWVYYWGFNLVRESGFIQSALKIIFYLFGLSLVVRITNKLPWYFLDFFVSLQHERSNLKKGFTLWIEAEKYNTVEYRTRFLKKVRKNNLMSARFQDAESLKQFALQIERDFLEFGQWSSSILSDATVSLFQRWFGSKDNIIGNSELSDGSDFTVWYFQFRQNNVNGLASWGVEFLDELYLLVEQLEQGSPSSMD